MQIPYFLTSADKPEILNLLFSRLADTQAGLEAELLRVPSCPASVQQHIDNVRIVEHELCAWWRAFKRSHAIPPEENLCAQLSNDEFVVDAYPKLPN